MNLAFAAPPPVTVPISGSDKRFPVHRIYCVGRNYAEHVKEMGGEVGRDPPFFFMKPADAIVLDGRFPYPAMSADVHHEIELVVALGEGGKIFGHAVGLDMTRRDLQAAAKKLGRPWDTAKGFDHSAPVSAIVPGTAPLTSGAITLDVNGARRQIGRYFRNDLERRRDHRRTGQALCAQSRGPHLHRHTFGRWRRAKRR